MRVSTPPPSWPAPPEGWTPPPGWQPDPAWGPPPPGRELWHEERANPFAGLYGFGAALLVLCVLLAIGTIGQGSTPSGYAAGIILGRCLVAGLVTAVIAFFSSRPWRLWVYPLVAFAAYAATPS
jgi:hypothetical protein